VTVPEEELRRRFVELEEMLLPQLPEVGPAAVERRGRGLRARRVLALGAVAALVAAAVVVGVERRPPWGQDGRVAEPAAPAARTTAPPPSSRAVAAGGTVARATTPPTSAPTTATTSPPAFSFSLRPRTARGGQVVTLSGGGCAAGARVDFAWVPADVLPASVGDLPPATTGRDGTYRATWRLGRFFQPGRYAVTATCARPRSSVTRVLTVSR
jgi:hypothetical protein